jgi:hypothetical protein
MPGNITNMENRAIKDVRQAFAVARKIHFNFWWRTDNSMGNEPET